MPPKERCTIAEPSHHRLTIAVLVFDGLALLDAIGPYEVLSRIPGSIVEFVAGEAEPVGDHRSAVQLMPTATFDQLPAPDVLLVPGGPGVHLAARDPYLLNWLATAHTTSRATAAVCTGTLLLGAAGLLADRRATTHQLVLDRLLNYDAQPVHERVVVDERIITAGGVSAGIELALMLAARLADAATARAIQFAIEYAPEVLVEAGADEDGALVQRMADLG